LDVPYHPHIHLIVTAGGLSLDPDKHFPMIRYAGLFSNRWRKQYLAQARMALNQSEPDDCDGNAQPLWAERQTDCTFCGHLRRIPRHRILRIEKFFDIKKGRPFVWQCHDCHEGVVIPGIYTNIPSFHVGGIKLVSLKAA
jgi:hypothetical protein